MATNKKWAPARKLEIAVAALKGEITCNELCKKYDVSPSLVNAWKKQLLDEGSQIYSKKDKSAVLEVEHEKLQKALYEKVGQLTMERDFLKKVSRKLNQDNVEN